MQRVAGSSNPIGFSRRALLAGGVSLAAAFTVAFAPWTAPAAAQDYPSRVVRIISPAPPGDPADVLARAFAEEASKELKQRFIVETRAGGMGIIGSNIVAKSPPDGYTLVVTTFSHSNNPFVNATMPYDTRKDFSAISMIGKSPGALFVVHPDAEAKTLHEFIDLARKNPNKYSYAHSGMGQMSGLAGELIKKMANIELTTVPYSGGSAYATDILAGRVSSGVMGLISAAQHVEAGTLRALALTGPKRTDAMPNIPTFQELGYKEMNLIGWFGIFGPAGMPRDRVELLSRVAAKAVRTPAFEQILKKYGIEAVGSTPEELERFVQTSLDETAAIVKRIGYVPPQAQ